MHPLGRQASGSLPLIVSLLISLGATAAASRGQLDRAHRRQLLSKTSTLEDLCRISWSEFELLIAETYRRDGNVVHLRGGAAPDGGVDVEVRTAEGQRWLVQCKQWKARKVGTRVVRELLGVVSKEGANLGILITCGGFTREAIGFAQGQPIQLIDGRALLGMIQGVTPRGDVAQIIVTPGVDSSEGGICPGCGSKLVVRRARRGTRAGQNFLGCSSFPKCRYTAPHG